MKKAKKKSKKARSRAKPSGKALGNYTVSLEKFKNLDPLFKTFHTKEFQNLTNQQKFECVNQRLLEQIQTAKIPCFLLAAVLDFIHRINEEKILVDYNFSNFEVWLNQFSLLKPQDNYAVRSKIIGKCIPRDQYQAMFPISMGKVYPGTHFVTAHSSPDLDTTVASFWGWADAFGAKVSEGRHLWNLPGGPPASVVELDYLFEQTFGKGVFTYIAKTRTALSVAGVDLMSQKGLVRKTLSDSTLVFDFEKDQKTIILVDESGYYLGDWRSFDVEGVRQVIMLLNNCLRWFENNLQVKLIALFSKEDLSLNDFPAFLQSVLGLKIKDCEPARDFSYKQNAYLQDYLVKVLYVKNGLDSTFEEFAHAMKNLALFDFQDFVEVFAALGKSQLCNQSGRIVENRPRIFNCLLRIIKELAHAIQSIRRFVERLDISFNIKTQVFCYTPQYVTSRADVDEIRSKIGSHPYLAVTFSDKDGKLCPIGIIPSTDIHKSTLGTVALRDFCNREEIKIPSYLEVISVIDHHKSYLNTSSPPVAFISDAQSTNVAVAQLAFEINDRFGRGGMSKKEIEKQIKEVKNKAGTASAIRILQRLLQRRLVVKNNAQFFIDPKREYVEYRHFLYAILDDTDLLTKVSLCDVECVASLLNRMKSISRQKEMETVNFDDITRNNNFVARAAERLLKNSDMYSLYSKIYQLKEKAVEKNLKLCAKGQPSTIFMDTKEQNGCSRVGQTKFFAKNFQAFKKHADQLRATWYEESQLFYKERSEFDLYIHMISTVAGADDLYRGKGRTFDHKDEIWIWIPFTEQSVGRLKSFLNAFRSSPQIVSNDLEVEFLGEKAKEYDKIFAESFVPGIRKTDREKKKALSLVVLRFNAGTINSRKAMLSPYLSKGS